MSFNTKKSFVMWFTLWSQKPHQLFWMVPTIEHYHLGVVIDNDLHWSSCAGSCTFSSPQHCSCLGTLSELQFTVKTGANFNCAVRVVYGLRKFGHVSALKRILE